jgi:hypothetical protein
VFGHVLMMAVVISAFSGTFVCPHNVFAPEEYAMNNEGTNLRYIMVSVVIGKRRG